MKSIIPFSVVFAGFILSQSAVANPQQITQLQNQVNALADQVESLGGQSSKTTIGGYGELHYNNYDNAANKIDFHRFVLFVGHEFDEKISFHSEIELEHSIAGESKVGEFELEQAYIQFEKTNNSNIKAGVFLIPIGLINETHEPPTFYGTERNPVEKQVVPATWWEAGVMYSGHSDSGVSYDVAIHSGLKTTGDPRSGRQKVGKADANDLAYTGRVKYTGIKGLELASTVNFQTDMDQAAGGLGAGTLVEIHAVYNIGKLKLTVLNANWDIKGSSFNTKGILLEASYKVTPKVGVFVRQNSWDHGGATGETQFDAGVNYWPHEDIVVKFDIQQQNIAAGDNGGFNIGLGYQF